jgi:tetratricopeptide (TPR) repeat protein
MSKPDPLRGTRAARAAIEDGVAYLRGGSLDRAWQRFVAAGELTADPAILSEALRRQADVRRRRGDWADALELVARAVHIAREHVIAECEAAALNVEGTIHLQRGDVDRAVRVYEQALKLEPGCHQRGLISQNLGSAHAGRGEHEEAARWYAISSEAFSEAGLRREQILSMSNQGSIRLDQGDLIAAEKTFRAALRRLGALPRGDAELQALVEMNLAETLARRGVRLEEAHELMARATGHFSVSSNRPYRVACHRVLALVANAQGDLGLAESALEGGLKLAREIESAPEVEYFERELSRLRERRPVPTRES